MSTNGEAQAGAKRERVQPLSDLAPQRPTTPLQELIKQSELEPVETEFFDKEFDQYVQRPDSPFSSQSRATIATIARVARSPSPIQRPKSRTRARIKKAKEKAEAKAQVAKLLVRSGHSKPTISAEAVTQRLDRPQDASAAKWWKEKFLEKDRENDQEKDKKKGAKSQVTEKPKEKKSGRPRSTSIRRIDSQTDSDDWESDCGDLTGTFITDPREWLALQGLVPPPSPRPKTLDGEYQPDWGNATMNSYNFDPNINPNAARQAPNAAQAQQMNGLNGGANWPNVGAQADMNVLWEYVQNLSQMHEGIRAQTQHVLNGVQQITARAADGSSSPGGAHVNGVSSAGHSQVAEIARLQNELSASNNRNDDLTSFVGKLQGLNQDYEATLSHLMDKLRPFAQQHSQALLSQKAHYLRLIEEERQQNLELRLEQTRWQESASRINENLKEALKALTEAELPYIRKIAALKADNKSLRRICGVPLMDDSDDDEDEEAEEDGGEQLRNGVPIQHESPEQMEQSDGQRIMSLRG